jgi:hypothetical protein
VDWINSNLFYEPAFVFRWRLVPQLDGGFQKQRGVVSGLWPETRDCVMVKSRHSLDATPIAKVSHYESRCLAVAKAEFTRGGVCAQSEAQIHGAVPGSHAVTAAGPALGSGLSGVDQTLHFLPRQTSSQGDGRAGGAGRVRGGVFAGGAGADESAASAPGPAKSAVSLRLDLSHHLQRPVKHPGIMGTRFIYRQTPLRAAEAGMAEVIPEIVRFLNILDWFCQDIRLFGPWLGQVALGKGNFPQGQRNFAARQGNFLVRLANFRSRLN